jgi:hypothetical protein
VDNFGACQSDDGEANCTTLEASMSRIADANSMAMRPFYPITS